MLCLAQGLLLAGDQCILLGDETLVGGNKALALEIQHKKRVT
jgi:hypothetical protein